MEWLADNFAEMQWSTSYGDTAEQNQDMKVLEWLKERQPDCLFDAVKHGVLHGHFDIAKWLHENEQDEARVVIDTVEKWHLEIVQFLRERRYILSPIFASLIDLAAEEGDLNGIRYLHASSVLSNCLTHSMDAALQYGHLVLVKWLHEHRSEGCASRAMAGAALNGHFEVVEWLHENCRGGCTTNAMDGAAKSSHLQVVKCLHEKRNEVWSTNAMDCAGSVEIVRFLHEHRSEGCTDRTMSYAGSGGDLETLMYLHASRIEEPCETAISTASNNHWEVFAWLYEMFPDQVHLVDAQSQLPDQPLALWIDAANVLDCLISSRDCKTAAGGRKS
ncbi:hypothetical protein FI667_g12183, partial [Globisporangium splendens]